jgi:hypothetical protein
MTIILFTVPFQKLNKINLDTQVENMNEII